MQQKTKMNHTHTTAQVKNTGNAKWWEGYGATAIVLSC